MSGKTFTTRCYEGGSETYGKYGVFYDTGKVMTFDTIFEFRAFVKSLERKGYIRGYSTIK